MIVDSSIYLFDHQRYREQVVPAFRQLHATNFAEPWLEAAWKSQQHKFTPHLREITADLMASSDLGADLPSGLIAQESEQKEKQNWEELQHLFQVAVATTCLGDGIFIGNAIDAPEIGVCLDEPLTLHQGISASLKLLEERGRAWGIGDEDGVMGVRGWLDPIETWFLADEMGQLALPPIEASFSAIKSAAANGIGTCSDGMSHPRLQASVRAIANIAVEQEQGMLWGWDL